MSNLFSELTPAGASAVVLLWLLAPTAGAQSGISPAAFVGKHLLRRAGSLPAMSPAPSHSAGDRGQSHVRSRARCRTPAPSTWPRPCALLVLARDYRRRRQNTAARAIVTFSGSACAEAPADGGAQPAIRLSTGQHRSLPYGQIEADRECHSDRVVRCRCGQADAESRVDEYPRAQDRRGTYTQEPHDLIPARHVPTSTLVFMKQALSKKNPRATSRGSPRAQYRVKSRTRRRAESHCPRMRNCSQRTPADPRGRSAGFLRQLLGGHRAVS
jgi:hypothetical protein